MNLEEFEERYEALSRKQKLLDFCSIEGLQKKSEGSDFCEEDFWCIANYLDEWIGYRVKDGLYYDCISLAQYVESTLNLYVSYDVSIAGLYKLDTNKISPKSAKACLFLFAQYLDCRYSSFWNSIKMYISDFYQVDDFNNYFIESFTDTENEIVNFLAEGDWNDRVAVKNILLLLKNNLHNN